MDSAPLISIVILNYNGEKWLRRCLQSVRDQSIFSRLEVIVADNLSSDGSDRLAAGLIREWPNARFIQHGANLGYCEGNNRAATGASGKFLMFLNNDLWLEPETLAILLAVVEREKAAAATPFIANYDDDTFQGLGAIGYDIFGLFTDRIPYSRPRDILMAEGCSYLIDRGVFERVRGFDRVLFMYADELDLSWKVWIAGHRVIGVPEARLHHRGAVNVNPKGDGKIVELRTSDSKRFYTNRNCLLVLLKNCQHILLLLVVFQILLLALEAVAGLILVRRWSFIRRAYIDAVLECWRLAPHIRAERARVRGFRKRGDWYMLRFLRFRPNRWDEVKRVVSLGIPRVAPN